MTWGLAALSFQFVQIKQLWFDLLEARDLWIWFQLSGPLHLASDLTLNNSKMISSLKTHQYVTENLKLNFIVVKVIIIIFTVINDNSK